MTTPYYIKIAPAAHAHIKDLPVKQQRFIIKLLEALAVNPRPPGSTKVAGMIGLYSEQIDLLRLVYKIEDHEILLLLVRSRPAKTI